MVNRPQRSLRPLRSEIIILTKWFSDWNPCEGSKPSQGLSCWIRKPLRLEHTIETKGWNKTINFDYCNRTK